MVHLVGITRQRRGALATVFCNALGRHREGQWMPIQCTSGDKGLVFRDPSGLNIVPPDEWKEATPEEIQTEMASQGREVFWTETISVPHGTRVELQDGNWITAGEPEGGS